MDFIPDAATRAFGTRLRRLSERIDLEVQEIYRAAGVDFEPRWFPVIAAIKESGPATVGELAERIGVTQAAVSQVRSALAAQGLIEARTDPKDQRRQVLALTAAGMARVSRLRSLWAAIGSATEELLAEVAPDFLRDVGALEASFANGGLAGRVMARLQDETTRPA